MIIDQRVIVSAPAEKVWDFVMDVPAVSSCVPGVESVSKIDDSTYAGALKIKVGPIGIRLEGKISVVEQNKETLQARMEVQAADRRVSGAVSGKMQMNLFAREDQQTDLAIHTDVAILGKLGEFGQAVMRKKADQIIAEFARNLSKTVGSS